MQSEHEFFHCCVYSMRTDRAVCLMIIRRYVDRPFLLSLCLVQMIVILTIASLEMQAQQSKKPHKKSLKAKASLQPVLDEKTHLFGFCNDKNEVVIPHRYTLAKDFVNGRAQVWLHGKTGFLDTTGKEIIPLQYDDAEAFWKLYTLVKKNGKYGMLDTGGRVLYPVIYDSIGVEPLSVGTILVFIRTKETERFGISDSTGKVLIPAQYLTIRDFSRIHPYAIVTKRSGMGLVHLEGREILPATFTKVLINRHQSLVYVQQGTKKGILDTNGRVLVPIQYDSISLPYEYSTTWNGWMKGLKTTLTPEKIRDSLQSLVMISAMQRGLPRSQSDMFAQIRFSAMERALKALQKDEQSSVLIFSDRVSSACVNATEKAWLALQWMAIYKSRKVSYTFDDDPAVAMRTTYMNDYSANALYAAILRAMGMRAVAVRGIHWIDTHTDSERFQEYGMAHIGHGSWCVVEIDGARYIINAAKAMGLNAHMLASPKIIPPKSATTKSSVTKSSMVKSAIMSPNTTMTHVPKGQMGMISHQKVALRDSTVLQSWRNVFCPDPEVFALYHYPYITDAQLQLQRTTRTAFETALRGSYYEQTKPLSQKEVMRCIRTDIIDSHARATPAKAEQSIVHLVQYLTAPAQNDFEKARALFAWVVMNVQYDWVGYRTKNYRSCRPDSVLRNKVAVCQGYAELFQALCKESGIACILVTGSAKGMSYMYGDEVKSNHAWNAVRLENRWYLMDATWADGEQTIRNEYFCGDPQFFITHHYPMEPFERGLQFLSRPLSSEEFRWQNKQF